MKSIRTKPRISAAIVFLAILVGVCLLIRLIILRLVHDDGNDTKGTTAAQIGLFVLVATLIVFIVGLLRLRFATIDISNQRITIFHPFRLKRQIFSFASFAGFYITSKKSRYLLHKVVVFRTNLGKEYSISDFEVSNLNTVQNEIWPYLNLLDLKTKEVLSNEKKEAYRTEEGRQFNLDQVRSIRFASWLTLTLLVLAAIIGSGLIVPLNRNFPFLLWMFIVFGSGFSISKLKLARKMSDRERSATNRRDSAQQGLLR
jgi:hypothetical protein